MNAKAAFSGDFTPVLAKHSKSFNLIDILAVGVDRIQRNFEPMQRQVEHWRQTQITDERAKLIFYAAFVDGKLNAPKSLLPEGLSWERPSTVRCTALHACLVGPRVARFRSVRLRDQSSL